MPCEDEHDSGRWHWQWRGVLSSSAVSATVVVLLPSFPSDLRSIARLLCCLPSSALLPFLCRGDAALPVIGAQYCDSGRRATEALTAPKRLTSQSSHTLGSSPSHPTPSPSVSPELFPIAPTHSYTVSTALTTHRAPVHSSNTAQSLCAVRLSLSSCLSPTTVLVLPLSYRTQLFEGIH